MAGVRQHVWRRGFAQTELAVEKHRPCQPEHGAARHHQRGIPDRHPQRVPEAEIGEATVTRVCRDAFCRHWYFVAGFPDANADDVWLDAESQQAA